MGLRSLSSTTFRSLRIRNYRYYFVGELVSTTGSWISLVALGWLLLDISDSAVALGVLTALEFVPMVVAGPWGGLMADRLDKRHILMATNSAMVVVSAVLGVLVLGGGIEVWMIYVMALVGGAVQVIDVPANGAFAAELVGVDEVENAVALDAASFQLARVLGPAIAGGIIAGVGTGACFVFDGASFLAGVAALAAMRPSELQTPEPAGHSPGQVREGLRYVWTTPGLRAVIVLMAVAGSLGLNSTVILPLLARDTFGEGAGAFGVMTSAMGVGAVVGALLVASRTGEQQRPLLVPGLALGAAMFLTAAAPNLASALPALVLVGGATTALFAGADAALQRRSEPTLRGRVMALFGVVFLGSLAFGGPVVGVVSELRGPRFTVAVGGAAIVVAAALMGRTAGEAASVREGQ